MKFSIILLSYNSELKAILLTLKSLLLQEFRDFEIIFADDGSEEKYVKEIQEYLFVNDFQNYYFSPSDQNLGTVKNILRALEYAKGEYVKCIGAGDLLFDDEILGYVYSQMKKNHAKWAFGEMSGYCISQNTIKNKNFWAPLEKRVYKCNNKKAIRKKVVIYKDHISGAAMFFEKEILQYYLERVAKSVLYVEDLLQVLIMLDKVDILYLSKTLVLYEVGTGISTAQKKNPRMERDFQNFEVYLKDNYKDALVEKRLQRNEILNSNKFFYKHIYLLFESPKRVFLEQCRRYGVFLKNKKLGFLDCKEFYDEFDLCRGSI